MSVYRLRMAQGSDFKSKGDIFWCDQDSTLGVLGTHSQKIEYPLTSWLTYLKHDTIYLHVRSPYASLCYNCHLRITLTKHSQITHLIIVQLRDISMFIWVIYFSWVTCHYSNVTWVSRITGRWIILSDSLCILAKIKTRKVCIAAPLWGNAPMTSGCHAGLASDSENLSRS